MQQNPDFAKIIEYMKAHWPSQVKPEWQVGLLEYPALVAKAIADFTMAATKNRHLIRIAGKGSTVWGWVDAADIQCK